ncbi:MAG: metal ABC transporter ATP-binding protein [Geitlerinemataceae cyanobacterium]
MLDLCRVSVRYRDVRALTDVCLTLERGQLAGLVGPNGAGKSSLVKAVSSLTDYSGTVTLDDRPISTQQQRIAYVPQRSQIDWHYPISAKNAVLTAQTVKMGWWCGFSAAARAIAREAMERLEVWNLRDRQIGELSGGQQQRVFLARALAQQADVFLLDEPLGGIDRKTEQIVRELLVELRDDNKLVVVCTHEWGDELALYDRLVLIDGHIIADGTPQAVLTPEHLARAYGRGLRLVGCTHPDDAPTAASTPASAAPASVSTVAPIAPSESPTREHS